MAAGNALGYVAIGIAAVAIAIAGAAMGTILQAKPEPAQPAQTREFYLFTEVNEVIEPNEEELGVTPDFFSLEEITVNQGDRVVVHFYNLEPEETQELHSFTMTAPYEMHNDVEASKNKTFEFTATESGIFEYQCVYHPQTMRGNLVVIG
jgi:plastocyanin